MCVLSMYSKNVCKISKEILLSNIFFMLLEKYLAPMNIVAPYSKQS